MSAEDEQVAADKVAFRATFVTKISLSVEVAAEDAEVAADKAWEYAQDYLNTLLGDGRHVISVDASLDGIGADEVEAQP